jgi:uracil-DNA glycosylase family 4
MAPEERLSQIAGEIERCTRCDLHLHARKGVPGSGDPHAEIMLIGEAPSIYDDRSGVPFSGPSGVFLDDLLALAGLSRSSVYLTNVVKHRLPVNQEIAPDEIAACADYLSRQIAAIDPKVIVALGRYAMARFFPKGKISQLHGQMKRIGGRIVVAMYNPAAALHQEALRQTVIDDFQHAIPVALAEARRLAESGQTGIEDEPPQQLSLF